MTPTSLGGHDCDPSLSDVQAQCLSDAPSDDMIGSVDKVDSVTIIRFDDRDESDDDIWRMDGPPPMDESSQSHSDSDVTDADRRDAPEAAAAATASTVRLLRHEHKAQRPASSRRIGGADPRHLHGARPQRPARRCRSAGRVVLTSF